jgi:hypothetical protein
VLAPCRIWPGRNLRSNGQAILHVDSVHLHITKFSCDFCDANGSYGSSSFLLTRSLSL